MRPVRWSLVSLVLLSILALMPHAAAAQPPQMPEPKNLQVLPKDMPRDQLMGTMRSFASAVGVNCTYCHVGTPPNMDFASDEKDEKKSARLMLKMTMSINKDTISQLGMHGGGQVTCYTCHRGAKQPPERLSAVLAETAGEKGAGAALAQYKKLREETLEAGLYDFRAPMLVAAAERLKSEKKPAEALGMLKGAAAIFPQSADVAAQLGITLAETGDKAAAETELQRALVIDPNHRPARGALDRLTGAAAPQR